MIAFFPDAYSDELLYSVFARYASRSGYMRYVFAAEDLYINRLTKPNIEFLNTLTDDALSWVTRNRSMEEVILKHTMYPYFARFLPKQRRRLAFETLVNMDDNYHNYLRLPKGVGCKKRFLRYCPVCAQVDRSCYGETYWHRLHQMIGVDICVEHNCCLVNSDIPIISKGSPSLITAEEVVGDSVYPVSEESEFRIHLALYMVKVFQAEIDLESDVLIGQFLHAAMDGTPYLSVRGKKRYMEQMWTDFLEFYSELEENPLCELWQLQKVFNGKRIGFWEVCMVAFFLNVPVNALMNLCLPTVNRTAEFDATVERLREEGMSYPQIAKAVGASCDYVKLIGKRR